jgi:phage-related tail protein
MVIKSMRADDIDEIKTKAKLERIERVGAEKMAPVMEELRKAQRELADHIKDSINLLIDLDFLYELQEFIDKSSL